MKLNESKADCAECQSCAHEWIPFCTACGKPAMYENLCGNCGPIGHEQCVLCWAEKETTR